MIYELKKYEDDEGKTIVERTPLPSQPGSAAVPIERVGVAGIRTPQGVMQIEFPIPPETTLEDAFARYGDFARAHLDKLQEEASSKIEVAHSMPTGLIRP